MTSYEPGTVAVATVRGVPNVRVFRATDHWTSDRPVDQRMTVTNLDDEVTDIRPLVVLDLYTYCQGIGYDRDDLLGVLRGKHRATAADFRSWLADQIEVQTKPSRIDEPGLFGIVEGWQRGEHPETDLSAFYLRQATEGEEDWTRTSDGKRFEWDEIAMPILVREGGVS